MRENPFDFTGRAALVTGCGSQGIGFAAARLLARLGALVAITSTTADRIEAREACARSTCPSVPATTSSGFSSSRSMRARRRPS